MSTYGQFCPVAKAMELLDERWTMLIVRELLAGSTHWGDLRRGLPRISPTLLSKRLKTLERVGIIDCVSHAGRTSYRPTEACQELRPVVEALGRWGKRWIPELGDDQLDPHLLLWDMHRRVNAAALPDQRVVVQFDFLDVESSVRRWWLVFQGDQVDVCDLDPGFEVDLTVEGSLRCLTMVWLGEQTWKQALKTGGLVMYGQTSLKAGLQRRLTLSDFAALERPSSQKAPAPATPGLREVSMSAARRPFHPGDTPRKQ